jgi:predicted transposase/invertase (TIGR01784 family)
VREVHDQEGFSDHFELHVLELPKLKALSDTNDEPALVAWGRFLAASTDEELDHLAMANPVLERAKAALERLSANREARELAEQREMALHSYALDLHEAQAQGRAEGREEGRAEGRVELLVQLLESKFGQLPDETRARVSRANEAELKRWSAKILSATSLDEVFGA